MGSNASPKAQVTLKDFLASIATIRGDLSNITAPPFVLDTKSVVELPGFWAERPSLFVAPASSSDPAERALLVLRWFLVSLKNQQYGGRSEDEGVKKPLNAFLGECFLAKWTENDDDNNDDSSGGETLLVSEQVSHHPPVTACRVWNEKHGVYAEGFTRQEVTLSLGTVTIKQMGHALLTLKNHGDETYLIPLPDVKVKGILSGLSGAYPELEGTYTIPSTSGYYSTIEFSGKSLLSRGGQRNEFTAKLYGPGKSSSNDNNNAEPLYTLTGQWTDSFTIYKGAETSQDAAFETLVLKDLPTVPLTLLEEDLDAQDPWETRRAWKGVRQALENGDMLGTAKAKSAVEQGQRDMRKDEERAGKTWKPLFFFKQDEGDEVAARLYKSISKDLNPDDTVGIWKFDQELWAQGVKRPFHGTLTPDNQTGTESGGPNIRNKHLIVGGYTGTSVDDAGVPASPASFETAHEYLAPNSAVNGSKQLTSPAATTTPAQATTPTRRSTDPASRKPQTSESVSDPSSSSFAKHRGKRERVKESIRKVRSSLSSGLSKRSSSSARSDVGSQAWSGAQKR